MTHNDEMNAMQRIMFRTMLERIVRDAIISTHVNVDDMSFVVTHNVDDETLTFVYATFKVYECDLTIDDDALTFVNVRDLCDTFMIVDDRIRQLIETFDTLRTLTIS